MLEKEVQHETPMPKTPVAPLAYAPRVSSCILLVKQKKEEEKKKNKIMMHAKAGKEDFVARKCKRG